jgi:hypothetical protein
VVLTNSIYDYGAEGYMRRSQMYHDLRAGAYIAERLINDSAPLTNDVVEMKGPAYFTPSNIRKLGRR